MKILNRLLKKNQKKNELSLTNEEVVEYYRILGEYSAITFKDRFSNILKNVNYITFFTSPIITEVNEVLTKDPTYKFSKEVVETVKFYRLIKVADYRVIDIARSNTRNDIITLEEIYKENSKIFYNKEQIENFLRSDYLIAIYKAIKLKLYKE